MVTNGIRCQRSWLFLLVCSVLNGSSAFLMPNSPNSHPAAMFRAPLLEAKNHESPLRLAMNEKNTDTPSKDVDPVAKASWYAVEAFGKLFGSKKPGGEMASAVSLDRQPQSLQETQARIKEDFNRSYFLSGEVDRLIYDEQCTFSDPFVSFRGRERFIENLASLGSFITKYSVRPLEFDEVSAGCVKTKCMVKLELGLPWRPVLAWPWGVEYRIDEETCLIFDHRETWDIEPIEGVKQIFRKATVSMDGAISTRNDK